MKNLRVYLKLIRFIICLAAFLMAIEGYWLSTHRFALNTAALLAAVAVGAAYAFSNVLNDILDLETDRVNYPDRPIPAGQVSRSEAVRLAGLLFVTSLLAAFLAGWRIFFVTAFFLALSVFYNLWAKKIPILGKVIVAALSAMTLAAGYFVAVAGDFPIIPVTVAFSFLLAREFISTISDAAGDQMGGRASIYTLWGEKRVLVICLALVNIAIIVLILPVFIFNLAWPWLYLLTIFSLSVLPTSLAVFAIWRNQSPDNIRRVSFSMRYVMFSTLISLLWLV